MHKIADKEFTMEDFSCEHLNRIGTSTLWETIDILNTARTLYLEGGRYRGEHYNAKDKQVWWQLIQLLPSSYNQTRNVMLNYEVLANIYRQRHSHKLDEWREFCKWIESLPYSEVIIGFKEYDTVEYAKEHPDFADHIKDAVEKMTKSVPCENKLEEDENNV